jgi:hypothetical protein
VTLSSCAHKLPDEPICIDVTETSGYCTKTISEEETFPEGQEWAEIKKYSLVLPLSSWAEIKKFILDICKDYGKCTESSTKIKQIEDQIPEDQLKRAIDINIKMNLNLP